jgi:hypothetical protein
MWTLTTVPLWGDERKEKDPFKCSARSRMPINPIP